ncbi:hypothetical protein E4U35_005557 [Claviceps purpurea]|nr:hypothetical protein E4U11_007691 [Claviceps purpurea]KAG6201925.1 hypothetical protein E4U35_005557 [Claviceps purpurea]
MDLRIDDRFNRVDAQFSSRPTGMNTQLTGFRTHMNPQLEDADGTLAEIKIRMEALW